MLTIPSGYNNYNGIWRSLAVGLCFLLVVVALTITIVLYTADDPVTPIEDVTVVSGANSKYFPNLLQFLGSVPNSPHLVVFDLGLTVEEIQTLRRRFPKVECRVFQFDEYPEWVNIKENVGHWAWKDVIISDMCLEFGGTVVWCDSRNKFTRSLFPLVNFCRDQGVYSPVSDGDILKWTHPLTVERMGVTDDMLGLPNRNAACLAFDTSKPWVLEFVAELRSACLTREWIAPEGSSRENHRQDQSVFTILYYQWQRKLQFQSRDRYLGFVIHTEVEN